MKTKGILITAICLLCFNLYSDIIPDNAHFLSHCMKITNISDYKGISLIGNVKEIGGGEYNYIINDSTCLSKGYRFNTLFIYAVNADYLSGMNIDEIVWAGSQNTSVANINLDPAGGYVDNLNPLSGHDEYYKIMGFTDVNVILHKWKEVFKFTNGAPDSIVTYSYPENNLVLYQDFSLIHKPVITDILKIFVYPNPSHDNLDIQIRTSQLGKVNLELFDMNGKILNTIQVNIPGEVYTFKYPIDKLPKGIYFLKFKYEDLIDIQKITIE
jgi:hypothetical protein